MASQYFSITWDQWDAKGENRKRKSASRSSKKLADAYVAKLEASGSASNIQVSELRKGGFRVI